jgi:predicted nuclease of predicted toxin-antitoxin system
VKIKLDENVPSRSAERLRALGHDVDTVITEGLTGRPDPDIWRAAQQEARFLVTQDLDFSDIRQFAPGTHYGILLVRVPDQLQWRLADYLTGWLGSAECESWSRCFVVATPLKVRVLRPE